MNQVDISKIQESFPLLIPNRNFKFWNGIISLEGEDIAVSISTPKFASLKNLSLMCPIKAKSTIQHKLTTYQNSIGKKNGNLLSMLEHLKSVENSKKHYTTFGQPEFKDGTLEKLDYYLYNQVLTELKQFEGENIVTCSGDLSEITLRTVDIRGVEHHIVVSISSDYPVKKPLVKDYNLPEVALADLSQAKTITELYKTFQATVDSLQDFWNTYENLTQNTWVIDPEHPSLRDTHCRIVIGENISMLVTFNPLDVNTCPDIKFLGPEKAVSSRIDSLEKKLKVEGWNEDISVYDNLLILLNIDEFPLQDEESESTPKQDECSICFMLRLEDQTLPTKICNNSKCNSFFHIPCLAQWFQAVPTNETSFNLISGDCPSCGEKILCPIKIS